jgi:hypothetical protein
VKNKEDRCDKHKLNDETPGISPIQGKDSTAKMQDITKNQTQDVVSILDKILVTTFPDYHHLSFYFLVNFSLSPH